MSCGCLGDGWRGALGSPNSVVGWLLVESSSKIKTLSLFLGRFFASSHAFFRVLPFFSLLQKRCINICIYTPSKQSRQKLRSVEQTSTKYELQVAAP